MNYVAIIGIVLLLWTLDRIWVDHNTVHPLKEREAENSARLLNSKIDEQVKILHQIRDTLRDIKESIHED